MQFVEIIYRFILGVLINLPIFVWAYRRKHLKMPWAMVTAATVGIILWIITPLTWLLLILFFISSSLLTKYKRRAKMSVMDKFQKGGERDVGQVLANSLGGVIFAIIFFIEASSQVPGVDLLFPPDPLNPWLLGFVAFSASVNADTWATEIGVISSTPPRWILNLKKEVEPGTSGGISVLGTLASLVGSFEISIFYFSYIFLMATFSDSVIPLDRVLFLTILAGMCGFIGSLIDSIEGATIQGFYYCPSCDYETEKKLHKKCGGTITELVRGKDWYSNDLVNGTSATLAGLLMVILLTLF